MTRRRSVKGDDRCVLIVQYSSNQDGSAFSGLLLANGLKENGWDTHVAFGFGGPMVSTYRQAGHKTYIAPHKNWLRRGNSFRFVKDVWFEWKRARAFGPLIDRINPQLVYLNTVVSFSAAVAARRSGVPTVWHLREMFADVGGEMHAPQWALPVVRKTIAFHAAELVANSLATADNLLGIERQTDVEIIPNAVRSAFFEDQRARDEARDEMGVPRAGQLIGVPGTLRPMKGHPFFFRAIASILRSQHDLCVAVTGDGEAEYVQSLKALVHELGISEQVRFLGWVDEMPAFYRACEFVCIPSRSEPFGRTVIEAFASGTPVVASAVGGIREIVDQNKTGFLVPYGDHHALRQSIDVMREDENLRKRMSRKARHVAEQRYHEEIYKRRVHAVAERRAQKSTL